MYKSLLSLSTTVLLALGAAFVPLHGHAATLHGSDYVMLAVPDLSQAAAFFENVLDCRLLGENADADSGPVSSMLLSCDSGSLIELSEASHIAPAPEVNQSDRGDEPVRFTSDDVANAAQWLRHQGVQIIGFPQILSSGPQAGQTVVNFVSPWGLKLQLVGSDAKVITAGP